MKSCRISCSWMKIELVSHGLWSQSSQIQCLWAIPWCNSSWWDTDWSKQTGEDWTDKSKQVSHKPTKSNRWAMNWQKQTGEPWTQKLVRNELLKTNWWAMNWWRQIIKQRSDNNKLVSHELTKTNRWAMNCRTPGVVNSQNKLKSHRFIKQAGKP